METFQHLNLPVINTRLDRKIIGGGSFIPHKRDKKGFYKKIEKNTDKIISSFSSLKNKYKTKIIPSLIYRIEINQKVDVKKISQDFTRLGMNIISVAPEKKGYWVVFSDENALTNFKKKLSQHAGIIQGAKYDSFFHVIENLEDIPIEEKIGKSLIDKPLSSKEEFLDIEFWRIDDTNKLKKFIEDLNKIFPKHFRIYDILITKSFAKARIKINNSVIKELLEFKEVINIERPPIISNKNFEHNQIDISEFNIQPPKKNSTGILILDSGIITNNPLLEKCVGDAQNFQEVEQNENDTVGHGTAVAGCSVYGDIEKCIDNKEFIASNYIFSAKIMYGVDDFFGNRITKYDPEKLIEKQYNDAIRYFLDNQLYKIKVVNISFGNSYEMFVSKMQRQFPLASLIDDLAKEYSDVVFVVSTGNQNPLNYYNNLADITDNYPNYLIDNENFKIINPATSALAITVGSIASTNNVPFNRSSYTNEEIWTPIANNLEPSPFTRTGFGVNDMIKPELVEIGGNYLLREEYGRVIENSGGKIALISHEIDKLFTFDYGTSYSAPKVAHILGKLANIYPNKSSNYLKNMLLQSATYDSLVTSNLWKKNTLKLNNNLKLQGYGRPDFFKALNTIENRVVLVNEDTIGLNKMKILSFPVPQNYFSTYGKKKISIVLTYNPETRITRGDSYIGNSLDFKLFHSTTAEELKAKFATNDDVIDIPDDLKKREIKLKPGTNKRRVGCHQKGIKEYKRNPLIEQHSPFYIVLFNINKWIIDENYLQEYCISVTIEHSEDINIYSQIRAELRERLQIK